MNSLIESFRMQIMWLNNNIHELNINCDDYIKIGKKSKLLKYLDKIGKKVTINTAELYNRKDHNKFDNFVGNLSDRYFMPVMKIIDFFMKFHKMRLYLSSKTKNKTFVQHELDRVFESRNKRIHYYDDLIEENLICLKLI